MSTKCSMNFTSMSVQASSLRGQDPGHLQQGQRVERHPAGAVGLLETAARWQVRAVDRADVVQAEEAAGEEVVALGVHPVDPPGEVHQQLRHQPGQEVGVAAAVDVPHVQRRPGVHRRVGVAERPLVGRQRAVGVLEPLAAHRQQLVLGERRVEVGQGHGVEGEVPGGEPRVLPGVGHRQDVPGVDVEPAGVAALATFRRWWRLGRVAVQPALHVVAVELLAPDHPGEGLPRHQPRVVVDRGRDHLVVELVGLRCAAARAPCRRPRRTPGADDGGRRRTRTTWVSPGADREAVPGRRLRADAGPGSPSRRPATTWSLIPSFGYAGESVRAVEPAQVGVVVAEQQVGRRAVGAGVELPGQLAEPRVVHRDPVGAGRPAARAVRRRRPTTRCCGTTGGAARAASTASGPALVTLISMSRSCGSALAWVTSTTQ